MQYKSSLQSFLQRFNQYKTATETFEMYYSKEKIWNRRINKSS